MAAQIRRAGKIAILSRDTHDKLRRAIIQEVVAQEAQEVPAPYLDFPDDEKPSVEKNEVLPLPLGAPAARTPPEDVVYPPTSPAQSAPGTPQAMDSSPERKVQISIRHHG